MPRYAPKMPQDDLKRMLVDKAIRNNYIEEYGDLDPEDPDLSRIVHMLLSEDLLGDVVKDWSKIEFSTENLDVIGEKLTPEGVPYLHIQAGGDWETPLVCIIYFDGKKLRGYVPKDGNSYNHSAKAAFGNNDDDDDACVRQFGGRKGRRNGYEDARADLTCVAKDIAGRIEARGTYTYDAAAVVSKASGEAKRQARVEASQDLSGPITADMVYAVISPAAGSAYVEFKLRSSGRKLRVDEGRRLIGVPESFKMTIPQYSDKDILWYTPMGCYPAQALSILEAAGFTKAPDNDISMYAGARTIFIG